MHGPSKYPIPHHLNLKKMKGIVFTEFLEMVEKDHGYEMVDYLIDHTELPSQGIYTAVGTYSHSEIVGLLVTLHKKIDVPIPKLLYKFGQYLFDTFLENYPDFFHEAENAFEFFDSIENHIHVQVIKLYPDAELPKFYTEHRDARELRLVYSSERKMADFALGLLEKSLEYYEEKAEIEMINLEEDATKVLFIITRQNGSN